MLSRPDDDRATTVFFPCVGLLDCRRKEYHRLHGEEGHRTSITRGAFSILVRGPSENPPARVPTDSLRLFTGACHYLVDLSPAIPVETLAGWYDLTPTGKHVGTDSVTSDAQGMSKVPG